jgi:hypothetical protein
MKNWKTTAAGIVGALITWLPQVQGALANGEKINWSVMAIGLAILILGVLAKDWNVTGGATPQ